MPQFSAPLRLSPSGPIIQNAEGGGFAPGSGAQMRLAENIQGISVTFVNLTYNTMGATPVTLTNPDPNKRYRFEASLCINAGATSAGSCKLQGQVSYDGGTVWHDLPTPDDKLITANAVATLHFVQAPTLASTLPNWPAVTPASIQFRVRAQVSDATSATVQLQGAQPLKLQMSEHL